MKNYNWPDGKEFAFTIVDDTDHSFINNIKPIYDHLYQSGIKTTKTTWVYPPRDQYTGYSLQNNEYLQYNLDLLKKGFEIQLHSVGSGPFSTSEIEKGYEDFKKLMGYYPNLHCNHGRNPDNIYWGSNRFSPPLSWITKLIYPAKMFQGEDPSSPHFWGNTCKALMKYCRGLVFNGICTHQYDSKMPYKIKARDQYSNYWFSSSDGHTLNEFNQLLSEDNVTKLVKSGGFCIVYTHFGLDFVSKSGHLDKEFKEKITNLSKHNGWFVPATQLLDHLITQKRPSNEYVSSTYLMSLNKNWLKDRLIKRIKTGI